MDTTDDHKPRTCKHCGKEMPPGTRPNKRFCSAQCRAAARYLKHREEFSERSRERYRQLKKAQKPQTAACKYCGKEFEKKDGRQNYCSVTCKRRMDSARARERKGLSQRKVGTEVTCPVCGKTFLCDPFGRQKYCSKECSAKAQKERKRRWEQLNRKATADKPPAPEPEPKPEPKPAPTECRTWVFGKEAINFGVPQYACLKPVKPPPPPPPPQKPEWRPWILENRPPNQAEMEMMLDKIFAKEATHENN